MMAEAIDVEVMEFGAHTRPEWSSLYCPDPIGIRTGDAEGLRSYIYHLAWLHVVSPRTLVEHAYVGISDKTYRFKGSYFSVQEARVINGVSPNAIEFAALTNRLTGRKDAVLMTMLPWINILPHDSRGLLKKFRSWCPKCFLAQPDVHGRCYEPLVWSLESYAFCHHHNVLLADRCPECNRHQPFLGRESDISRCNYCGHSLAGRYATPIDKAIPNQETRALKEYMTRYTVELVAHSGDKIARRAKGKLITGIKKIIQEYRHLGGGGKNFYMNFFNIRKETLSQWTRGRYLPRLNMLMLFCGMVRISPVKMLYSEVLRVDPSQLTSPDNMGNTVDIRSAKNLYQLRTYIDALKQRKRTYNISQTRLSLIFGIDQKVLRSMLGDIFDGFEKHRSNRYDDLIRSIEGRHKAIESTVKDLNLLGRYISINDVEIRLGLPGILHNPRYYATYAKAVSRCRKTPGYDTTLEATEFLIDYDWLETNFMEID